MITAPSTLTISLQTQRQFILGKQGLYPGRRWQGKTGAAQAMREGVVVQIDPLRIIARSHDITLHSRVIDYTPEMLNELLYAERGFFDYGGVVMVHPMEALPYWRVVMARVGEQRAYLGEQNRAAVEEVLAALRGQGPLGNRDFAAPPGKKQYWHASKTTAQALYYLWLKGEVMTHSRRGFERRYDLAERIAPPEHNWQAAAADAEDYFARRALQELSLADLRGWRGHFQGLIARKVSLEEAAARLQALVEAGQAAQVRLEEDEKDPARYLLAEDAQLLEAVQAGRIPEAWQAAGQTTAEEAVFLAPLEMVSARGRALPLFGFNYKWEVYKPVEKRIWGYYVLPVLYGDRLAARFDSEVNRKEKVLRIKRLWLEEGVRLEDGLRAALARGLERFARFAGAERVEGVP